MKINEANAAVDQINKDTRYAGTIVGATDNHMVIAINTSTGQEVETFTTAEEVAVFVDYES